jgi:hypothetical protein
MKISEMNNDQASEAIVRICAPVASICEDDEVKSLLDSIDKLGKEQGDPIKAVTNFIPRLVAFGLQKHKADVYEIVGALTGTSTARVGKLNFVETVKAVRESWDDVLAGFFTSSATAETKTTEE